MIKEWWIKSGKEEWIGGNKIGDSGAIMLGEALKCNRALTTLVLKCDRRRRRRRRRRERKK